MTCLFGQGLGAGPAERGLSCSYGTSRKAVASEASAIMSPLQALAPFSLSERANLLSVASVIFVKLKCFHQLIML